jgi:NNP family nitrate/nitrite transporter-like MFS transporter
VCTFGGFVGLASSLTIYFNDQYGLTPIVAGYFTAACEFVGSLVWPIGGNVADRIGGINGDPMLFGRAGEEIAALAAAGIPVDVVPGLWPSWNWASRSSRPDSRCP